MSREQGAGSKMQRTGLRERWREAAGRLAAMLDVPRESVGDDGESNHAAATQATHTWSAEVQQRAWSEVLDIPWTDDLRERRVALSFVEQFPIRFARQHAVVALTSPIRWRWPSVHSRRGLYSTSCAGICDAP